MERSRRDAFGLCLGLAALVALTYGRAALHDFVNLDDADYIFENPYVLRGLSLDGLYWSFQTLHVGNWHPLTWLSLMLDAELYGRTPGGFHVTNVLLHAANVLLLFGLLRAMTGAPWRSAGVAALFAVHPQHVESVAWVSERKDVLSTTFWLLTSWAYMAYVRRGGARRYLLLALSYALGLMAKPMLVTLPFVLLLLDYWPLGRMSSRRRLGRLVLEKLPLFALALAACVVAGIGQAHGGAVGSLAGFPLAVRVLNALVSYVAYLGKTLWPADLACFYPHPVIASPGQLGWLVGAGVAAGVLLGTVTWMSLRLARTRPYLLVGWLWYLGALVPVIGLVQVGLQARADRYTYVPMIGIYLLAVWSAADLAERWSAGQKVAAAACLAIVGGLAISSWNQVATWRDSRALFEHALRVTERNFVAHNGLGVAHRASGDLALALQELGLAIEIYPAYFPSYANRCDAYLALGRYDRALADCTRAIELHTGYYPAHANRCAVYEEQGEHDRAVAECTTAIRLRPDLPQAYNNRGNANRALGRFDPALEDLARAIEIARDDPLAYNNRGTVYEALAKYELAVRDYTHALELKADYPEAYSNRGHAHLALGQHDQALRDFTRAIELQPELAEAYLNRGETYQALGAYALALADFERAIAAKPSFAEAHNNLGWLLAACPEPTCRDGERAVASAERACELLGFAQFSALDTLAAAYAETNRFDEAVAWETKALALAPEEARPELRARLELYRAGQPYRLAARSSTSE